VAVAVVVNTAAAAVAVAVTVINPLVRFRSGPGVSPGLDFLSLAAPCSPVGWVSLSFGPD
jgi:hypothetical protein